MRRGRWWYRAQHPKCWVGLHNWRRVDGTLRPGPTGMTLRWRVVGPNGTYLKAVCRVCFKRVFDS